MMAVVKAGLNRYAGRSCTGLGIVLACTWMLIGCAAPDAPGTVIPRIASPTLRATLVPESAADSEAAVDVVREFEAAIRARNELVALLLLTPMAQQRVAASDLETFVAKSWRTEGLSNCGAIVDGDNSVVVCTRSGRPGERPLRISLLRLHNTWKIDDLEDGQP